MEKHFSKKQLSNCLRLLLRPLAKFCVRHGLKIQDITECLKLELAYISSKELEKKNQKANVSKISAITGIHRRDIDRIDKGDYKLDNMKDLATKIITHWQTKDKYTTSNNKPLVLSYNGEDNLFNQLIKDVGTDLNSGTVLYELKRLGLVAEKKRGIHLIKRNVIEREDITEGFHIASDDIKSLLETVEYNILSETDIPQHHLRTDFNRVRSLDAARINEWLLKAGHNFHLKIREYLAQFDQDTYPDSNYNGDYTEVSLTSFTNIKDKESNS